MTVQEKIKLGEYENKKPYISPKENKQAWLDYHNEDDRIRNQFKKDLLEQFNLSGERAEKLFHVAWDNGHSMGYHEVLFELEEILNITDAELEELL